jgi:alpha-galactosidase
MGITSFCGITVSIFRRNAWWLMAAVCVLAVSWPATAQSTADIRYDETARTFRLEAADVSYVLGVNQEGELQSLYWGQRLRPADPIPAAQVDKGTSSFELPVNATPQEYVGWGGGLVVVPDVKITFPDGNRDLALRYVSHSININNNTLSIAMRDISRDVTVTLLYQMDAATGIVARSARIDNHTDAPLTVEQAFAATWNLPASSDYQLRYLTGRWAGEWNLQQGPLHPGKVVLESRRGSTGDEVNPWFAIERGNEPDQDTGNVWFGALGWSGSWQINIEQDWQHRVRVTGGYTPFDFAYRLAPGESLETPKFYGGYSASGIGGASRLLHRLEMDTTIPQPHRLRPVLYNSWEATGFDVTEAGQEALAEKAASLGVERFVMDDGWFGERKDDHAGLGDWSVNPQKFPHGLKPLIDKVHGLGMDFGLWVEPEMVNPDSELYRKHPDWVLNFAGRPRTEGRHQLVLNLARPDVRAYVYGFLDKLLAENDIAFLKWDYNRNWAEPGWPAAQLDEQKEVYVKYVENLYGILAELRQKHPRVEIESCSGGGARVDLGILRYVDEVWPSDNTDPFDRLSIQNGFTYAYAPGLMMAWVTDSPNWMNQRSTSLEYRFLSSMQGSLGIGANLNKWTPGDFATAKKLVAAYKQVRETVQEGALYRLISPVVSEYAATESVARDGHAAAVFAFLHSSQEGQPFPQLYLRGLDPDATYSLHLQAGQLADGAVERASGDYWMHHGVAVSLRSDFQAAFFTLEREGN